MITAVLDWLYEYMLLSGIVSMIILMYVGFFYLGKRTATEKRPAYKWVIAGIVFAFFIALWIPLFSGNYGYSHDSKDATLVGDKFCFLDTYVRRSRTGSWDDVRLYIVDANTGEKQFRDFIGHKGEILAAENGLLLYSDEESYYLLNVSTNKIVKTFSKETLPQLYPQTAPGIGEIDFGNGENGISTMLLNVTSKNGNRFYIDPFSGKIADSAFDVPTRRLFFEHNFESIKIAGDSVTPKKSVAFNTKNGSVASNLGFYYKQAWTNSPNGKTYIYPQFMAAYLKDGIIVFKSFDTTDKTSFTVTAVEDMNLKEVWNIKESDLQSGNNELKHWTKYKSNLIFNLDDYFYSVDVITGKVNWKKRL